MPFIYISLVAALVFGGILIAALVSRRDNRKANLLLCGIIAGALFIQWIYALKVTGADVNYPYLWGVTFPVTLLLNAFLYLYVLALTVPGFRFSKKHLLLLLPFVCGLIWYAYLQTMQQTFNPWERYVRSVVSFLVNSAFLYACFRQLHFFRGQAKLLFSDNSRIHIKWLEFFLILFVIPWLVRAADILTGPFITMEKISVPTVTAILLLIGFFGLRQSELFAGNETPEIESIVAPPPKAGGPSLIAEGDLQRCKEQLVAYVAKEKPYLNPELRLTDLAKALHLKGYLMSEVLNRGLGMSFYDFINQQRIEEAKRRLLDPTFSHYNILGIATESGFNSKSVFNEVFRKTVGITPSEFRKNPPSAPH